MDNDSVLPEKPKQAPRLAPPTLQAFASSWTYPVPPPNAWDKYPPDVQQRFLEEWQATAKHHRDAEMRQIDLRATELRMQDDENKRTFNFDVQALWLSSFVIVLIFLTAAGLAYLGITWGAAVALATALALFIHKRKDKSEAATATDTPSSSTEQTSNT